MQCINCKNLEFCKWESLLKNKEEDLKEDTNGMLEVNCSQFEDEKGNVNEYGKLECKQCKYKAICKFQRPIEDYSLRRKTKNCLNIKCNKFQEIDGIELLEEDSNMNLLTDIEEKSITEIK